MTTIATDQSVATLINVFEVDADRQQALVDLLADATEKVMQHAPGFVSANIHASLDGERVINYAQWRSVEDFEAMLRDPIAREHMAAAGAMAHAEPRIHTVVSVHQA